MHSFVAMPIAWAWLGTGIEWRRKRLLLLIPALATVVHGGAVEGWLAFLTLAAVLLSRPIRNRKWLKIAGLAIAVSVFFSFGESRPRSGLFPDAVVTSHTLAILALALDMPLLAVAAGFTGTRSTVIVLAVAVRPSLRTVFPLIAYLIGFGVWFVLIAPDSVTAERADVSAGVASRSALNSDWWQGWFGSGFRNFPGDQRPHNVAASLWAQSGLLSLPLFGALAWLLWRLKFAALPVLPMLFFSDWLVSTAGGIYTFAIVQWLHEQKTRPECGRYEQVQPPPWATVSVVTDQ